jgi:hypothetical protein
LKEGAIVLGTGGDNSYKGVGDGFEGAMTTGYASESREEAVQANLVAAGYGRGAAGERFRSGRADREILAGRRGAGLRMTLLERFARVRSRAEDRCARIT